jgi:preprotein translocase SecE subunit
MAIVKTTTRDSEGGSKNGENVDIEKPIDRTKSVVNQGGRPTARPTRQQGVVNRPAPQQLSQGGVKGFFQDTVTELKRVVWPAKEARNAGTIVTVGMLIFFALYIFGLDSLMRVVFIALGILPENALR